VQRIVDAIASGADVDRIAAVTFTVAAAGEMKLRIGQKLEAAGETAAVRRLERAFIGTIHAFCANMLRQ
jgi:ATP-dependent helicase/nuclease subunit A